MAKLAGLYAITLVWLQVMFGFLKEDHLSRFLLPQWSIGVHRALGMLTLLVTGAHFFLFIGAVSVRQQAVAFHLLIPDFSSGYYSTVVSLGWLALAGLLLVATVGLLHKKLENAWRWVHRLSLAVIILALVHAQMLGSDAGSNLNEYLYIFYGVTLLLAVSRRVYFHLIRGRA